MYTKTFEAHPQKNFATRGHAVNYPCEIMEYLKCIKDNNGYVQGDRINVLDSFVASGKIPSNEKEKKGKMVPLDWDCWDFIHKEFFN